MSIETALSGLVQQQSALINTFYTQVNTWNATVNSAVNTLQVAVNNVVNQGAMALLHRTFYVDSVGGSDTNIGTSSSHPFKTIIKALNSIPVNGSSNIYLKAQQIHDFTDDITLHNQTVTISSYDHTRLTNTTTDDNYISNLSAPYREDLPKIRQKWEVYIDGGLRIVRGYRIYGRFNLTFANCRLETYTAPSNTEAGDPTNGYYEHPTVGMLYNMSGSVSFSNCDISVKQDSILRKYYGEPVLFSAHGCRFFKYIVTHINPIPGTGTGTQRYFFMDSAGGTNIIQFIGCVRNTGTGLVSPPEVSKPFKDFVYLRPMSTPKNYLTNFAVE